MRKAGTDEFLFLNSCFPYSTCDSWRQFFAVRQMIAVPAGQSGVAGIFKQKLQHRRFNMAIAKDDVGATLVACKRVSTFF
jgi:hypothetical protein